MWKLWVVAWAAGAVWVPRSTLHLVFVDSVTAPEVWQRWYEDSRVRLNVTGRQPFESEADRLSIASDVKSTNAFLDGSVVSFGSEEVSAPRWLSSSVFRGADHRSSGWFSSDPGVSVWAKVFHGLRTALERDDRSTHFVLVPGDSVPVKPFPIWWADLQIDRRSRLAVTVTDPDTGLVSVSPWLILTRSHAAWAVAHPNDWVTNPGRLATRLEGARLDNATEISFTQRVWNPAQQRTQNPVFKKASPKVFTRFVGTVGETGTGTGSGTDSDSGTDSGDSIPSNSLRYGLVKHLVELKGVWMIRGVSSATTVIGCRMTELEYFTHWVRIGAGDGDFIGEPGPSREARLRDTDKRLASRCSLLQALRQTLTLKAANRTQDFWNKGWTTVPRGDAGWYGGWVD